MKFFPVLLVSVLCGSACFAQSKADSVKAAEIINKSAEAYAHLKTYVDSGKLIQTMVNNGRVSKSALIFKTAYTNTGDFNFEYYTVGKSNSLYTINRAANAVKTWWGITDKEEVPASLKSALFAATGVSSNTSTFVPELLLSTDFKNVNFYKSTKTHTLAGVEKIDGKDCYKIASNGIYGKMVIWISEKDFLIRKIETEKVIDPAKTEARVNKIAEELKKKDSVKYREAIKANKLLADINKRDSLRGEPRQAFTVKDSYTFAPVVDHKVNPELLKYRPNREVAL